MSRFVYWLCRLFGTVPCRACFHPGRDHERGDRLRALPRCRMCSEYAARLQAASPSGFTRHDVYIKAIHAYDPEPYR
jgi:hypothetical protein